MTKAQALWGWGRRYARSGVANRYETLYVIMFDTSCQGEYSHVLCASWEAVTTIWRHGVMVLWERSVVTRYMQPRKGNYEKKAAHTAGKRQEVYEREAAHPGQ